MTDIFVYPGEPNPNDVRLSDPTVLRSSGSDLTLAITGVSLTGEVGTLIADRAVFVSGVESAVATGTISPEFGIFLTGVAGTGAVGDIVADRDILLSGVFSALAVGDLVASGGDSSVTYGGVSGPDVGFRRTNLGGQSGVSINDPNWIWGPD